MKRPIFMLSILFLLICSISSCCTKCTGMFGVQVDICRNQYSSDADYNNAIAAMEVGGYTCK